MIRQTLMAFLIYLVLFSHQPTMPPATGWRILWTVACVFIAIINANQTTTKKASVEGNYTDLDDLPFFYKRYGVRGVNFDYDNERRRPYIMCQSFNRVECEANNHTDCIKPVKCFPQNRMDSLGCMSVMSNKHSNDGSIFEPHIQGCWTQNRDDGEQCSTNVSCSMINRRMHPPKSGIIFCCCRSHLCNSDMANIALLPPESEKDVSSTIPPPASNTFSLVYLIIAAVCSISIALALYYMVHYYCKLAKKRYRNRIIRRSADEDGDISNGLIRKGSVYGSC